MKVNVLMQSYPSVVSAGLTHNYGIVKLAEIGGARMAKPLMRRKSNGSLRMTKKKTPAGFPQVSLPLQRCSYVLQTTISDQKLTLRLVFHVVPKP